MNGPNAIVVREASPAVVDVLIDLDPMGQASNPADRTAIEAWVTAGYTLVAQSGDDILGYVVTVPGHLFDRDFVAMLNVHSSHRRRGIGSALLTTSVQRAVSNRVFTSTNTSNTPMRAILASNGWLHSGTLDGLDPGDPEEFYYIDR